MEYGKLDGHMYGKLNADRTELTIIGVVGIGGWSSNRKGQTVKVGSKDLKVLTPDNLDGVDEYAGFGVVRGRVIQTV